MRRLLLIGFAVAVVSLFSVENAFAVPVDLELVFAVDVSGSVDDADFTLQKTGYVQAFQNPALVTAIQSGAIGSIAVSFVYWSDNAAQAVPWTLINDAASANAFAAAINAAARPFSGGTGLTNAMNFSAGLFAANGFEGTRNVIDISGDGAESQVCSFNQLNCAPLQAARAAALAGGVTTINALWIDDRDFFGDDLGDTINALQYGALNVIGGADPFQQIAQDFSEFGNAIDQKIIREVSPVPEPSTLLLLGAGIVGLADAIRRRNRHG